MNLLKALIADSKELFTFRITFSPDLFRETKQKRKQITSKQQSLFFSCLPEFNFYGKIFFSFPPWFLNAKILCGTFFLEEPSNSGVLIKFVLYRN